MITLIGELFGAESKAQVYGFLHSFFLNKTSTTELIRKYTYSPQMHTVVLFALPQKC